MSGAGGALLSLGDAERWRVDLASMSDADANKECLVNLMHAEKMLLAALPHFADYHAHSLRGWFAECAEVRRRHCEGFTLQHTDVPCSPDCTQPLASTPLAAACGLAGGAEPTADGDPDSPVSQRLRILLRQAHSPSHAWLLKAVGQSALPTVDGAAGLLPDVVPQLLPHVELIEDVLGLTVSGVALEADSRATAEWLERLQGAMEGTADHRASGDIAVADEEGVRAREALAALLDVVARKQRVIRHLTFQYGEVFACVPHLLSDTVGWCRDAKGALREVVAAVRSDMALLARCVVTLEEEDQAAEAGHRALQDEAACAVEASEQALIALWGDMFNNRYSLAIDGLLEQQQALVDARSRDVMRFADSVEALEAHRCMMRASLTVIGQRQASLDRIRSAADQRIVAVCQVERTFLDVCRELRQFYDASREHHADLLRRSYKEAFAYTRRLFFLHSFEDFRHTRLFEHQRGQVLMLEAMREKAVDTLDPKARGVCDALHNTLTQMHTTTQCISRDRLEVRALSDSLDSLCVELRLHGLEVQHPQSDINTVLLAQWEHSIQCRDQLNALREGDTPELINDELRRIEDARAKLEASKGTVSTHALLECIFAELGTGKVEGTPRQPAVAQ